eukprot:gnl/Trimastix_PCT/2993.p1 GENE.gnl/Trimastix_PCT/2993~~gnl/Trimastix_PCT/2993.p1  ORF type:complete len:493 (+),score=58.02 gnl/Trimastix_PCT/2993:100-1578(+)
MRLGFIVGSWFFANCILTNLNKAVMISVRIPIFMTLTHVSLTFAIIFVALCFSRIERTSVTLKQTLAMLFITLVESLQLIVSNVALIHASVPLYQTIRSTNPGTQALLSWILFGEWYSWKASLSVLGMIGCAVLASYGDFSRSFLGIFLTLLSCLLSNIRNTAVDALLKGRQFRFFSKDASTAKRQRSAAHPHAHSPVPSLTGAQTLDLPSPHQGEPSFGSNHCVESKPDSAPRKKHCGLSPSGSDSPSFPHNGQPRPPLPSPSLGAVTDIGCEPQPQPQLDVKVTPMAPPDVRLFAYLKAGFSMLVALCVASFSHEPSVLFPPHQVTGSIQHPMRFGILLTLSSLAAAVVTTFSLFGIQKTSALYMQVMTVAKHFVASLFGVVFFGKQLSTLFWVGLIGVSVCCALFNYEVFKQKRKRDEPPTIKQQSDIQFTSPKPQPTHAQTSSSQDGHHHASSPEILFFVFAVMSFLSFVVVVPWLSYRKSKSAIINT